MIINYLANNIINPLVFGMGLMLAWCVIPFYIKLNAEKLVIWFTLFYVIVMVTNVIIYRML